MTRNEIKVISKKVRMGIATSEEDQRLSDWENRPRRKTKPVRSIFDLHIAKRLWEADAKDLNR
jgi:hypothetical protein